MIYKYKQYVHDVKTLDENYVDLFIQAKSIIDDPLISEMKKYVLHNTDVSLAITSADLQIATIDFHDAVNKIRTFYICFLLHYDLTLKKALDAKILSFIEV